MTNCGRKYRKAAYERRPLRTCFGKSTGDDFSLISKLYSYVVISVSLQQFSCRILTNRNYGICKSNFPQSHVAMLRRNIDLGGLKLDVMLLTLLKLFNTLKPDIAKSAPETEHSITNPISYHTKPHIRFWIIVITSVWIQLIPVISSPAYLSQDHLLHTFCCFETLQKYVNFSGLCDSPNSTSSDRILAPHTDFFAY